jgi:hypothetical protein
MLDFSLATAPQMLPLLMQVQTTVAQHGPKSVLVLANLLSFADMGELFGQRLRYSLLDVGYGCGDHLL